jgi:hypothetical protein
VADHNILRNYYQYRCLNEAFAFFIETISTKDSDIGATIAEITPQLDKIDCQKLVYAENYPQIYKYSKYLGYNYAAHLMETIPEEKERYLEAGRLIRGGYDAILAAFLLSESKTSDSVPKLLAYCTGD